MAKSNNANERVARLRQDNAIAVPAPQAVYSEAPVRHRKVGKSGAVHIAGLAQGIRVNVLQVEPQTFVVSMRPEREIRELASTMPLAAQSKFAALADVIRGRSYPTTVVRERGTYVGRIAVPPITDEDIVNDSDDTRTRRVR